MNMSYNDYLEMFASEKVSLSQFDTDLFTQLCVAYLMKLIRSPVAFSTEIESSPSSQIMYCTIELVVSDRVNARVIKNIGRFTYYKGACVRALTEWIINNEEASFDGSHGICVFSDDYHDCAIEGLDALLESLP